MSWNDGYFVDSEYIGAYFMNLNPLLMNLNLTFAGIDVNHSDDIFPKEDMSYLELGFGKGYSIGLHAIANKGKFVGTDFNPSHALHAKKLTHGICNEDSLKIYDDSFSELFERLKKENAKFDYIVMHGVFSWISESNQKILLEIIGSFLKVGGFVYISYNAFPGWDGKWSARKLLTLYKNQAPGNSGEKLHNSIAFF